MLFNASLPTWFIVPREFREVLWMVITPAMAQRNVFLMECAFVKFVESKVACANIEEAHRVLICRSPILIASRVSTAAPVQPFLDLVLTP